MQVNENASFGSWVRLRRKALDLTQASLADRVGYAVVTIKKIEQDERRPSRQMAERLADILVVARSEREYFIQAALGEKSPIRLPKPLVEVVTVKVSKPIQNLPAYASPIIGRKKEINKILHLLLHDNRLVTLIGPGGVGKTRLAITAGWAGLHCFKDGVVFISLASLSDHKLIEDQVAQGLGVKQRNDRSIREGLIDFVFERQLLIILDNFEHLLAAATWIAYLLTNAPNLRILVTSRVGLDLSMERLFPIKPLSLPKIQSEDINRSELARITSSDAVRLFLERARAHSPDFTISRKNAAFVAEICNRLDGLPLAIELAASRVYQIPLSNILQRLEKRLDLASHGHIDLPLRQQTLRATFSWSYELLNPTEKDLFPRLGIFSGGFTYEMAEAVSEKTSSYDFSNALSGLVAHNLVICQPNKRYSMLETIREYALEQLTETGLLERTRIAHLDYFTQFVEKAEHQLWIHEDEWIHFLIVEQSNIELALTWSLKRKEANQEEVLKGGQIVGGIWYFWLLTGRLRANQRWVDMVLKRINMPELVLARLLVANGVSHWQHGELSKSEKDMKNAIDMFYFLEDTPGLAQSLHMYGHIVFDCQRYQDAEKLFRESMALYLSIDDEAMKAILINDLGLVAMHQNDIASAKKYYQESLFLFEQHKMYGYIAQTCLRMGDLARLEGNYLQAGELYQKSLTINKETKSQLEIASNLHKMSYIALHTRDIKQALKLQYESLAIQQECGNLQGIAECLAALAGSAVTQGEDLRAGRLFGAAKGLLESLGLPMAPADMAEWKRDEQIARTRINPDLFEMEWSNGAADPIERLVEEILSES
jgi:predicted ATPase/DNA-binding XRE family transcriptional regulator/Tfp pilus assembly protein PilF